MLVYQRVGCNDKEELLQAFDTAERIPRAKNGPKNATRQQRLSVKGQTRAGPFPMFGHNHHPLVN